MEQQSHDVSKKRSAVLALIRDEQDRFRVHDVHLTAALDEVYHYMITKVDPLLTKALEEVLLHQPDQTADFLANSVRGTLNLKNYNYVLMPIQKALTRTQYFDQKVRHLMILATQTAIRERPADVQEFLAGVFEASSKS